MNYLAIIGSKRKNGNTSILVDKVLEEINPLDNQVKKIFIDDYSFSGCRGCNGCKDSTTCILNDDMKELYQMIEDCDVLILASPTYYYNVTSDIKKFIDRLFCLNIFDKKDRSIWTSKYHGDQYDKKAVVISVCEQNSKEDIGFTTLAMSKPLQDLGFKVIYTLEAIKSFDKGDVLKHQEILEDAKTCSILLNNLKKDAKK